MRTAEDDRTSRAIIRDVALSLFAQHGPDKVSVRQIAAAAGVSPALIVHHFATKDGLREACDRHVVATFERLLGELSGPDAAALHTADGAGSVGQLMLRHLPDDSPVPAYLRRLLLTDSPAGRAVFRQLFELSQSVLATLAAAGQAEVGRDPAARAAFLLVNDLAVMLLRDQLTEVLEVDPLSPDGLARWAPEVLTIYAGGLTAGPTLSKEEK